MSYNLSNSYPYQRYLGELENYSIDKKKNRKKNVKYTTSDNGDFIVLKDGNIIKTIQLPTYVNLKEKLEGIKLEIDTNKKDILRLRDKIIRGNTNEKLNDFFYQLKDNYKNKIDRYNETLTTYKEINNIDEKNTNIKILYQKLDNLMETKRQLLINISKEKDKINKNKLIVEYTSKEKDSLNDKIQDINNQIIKLTGIRELFEENEMKYFKVNKDNLIDKYLIYMEDKPIKKQKKIQEIAEEKQEIEIIPEEKEEKVLKEYEENKIYFNSKIKKYNYLSNFGLYPFISTVYGDIGKEYEWKSVEHYFQASKFSGEDNKENIEYIEEIQQAKTPAISKKLGSIKKPKNGARLREDWNKDTTEKLDDGTILKLKDLVMLQGLTYKFDSHPEIKEKLIKTYPSILIEESKTDSYWGNGKDGKGKNMLGKILMELRKQYLGNVKELQIVDKKIKSTFKIKELNKSPIILKKSKKITKTIKPKDDNKKIDINIEIKSPLQIKELNKSPVILKKSKKIKKNEDGSVLLKKNKKKQKGGNNINDKLTTIKNITSNDKNLGILKSKNKKTHKNTKNIQWINTDSLGNTLNDNSQSLLDMDKDFKELDLSNLSLDLFDENNGDIINNNNNTELKNIIINHTMDGGHNNTKKNETKEKEEIGLNKESIIRMFENDIINDVNRNNIKSIKINL